MFAGLSVGNGTFATTITHSDISSNQLAASNTSGSVTLQGAGIGHVNGAPLVLRDTTVTRNLATGKGPGGIDQGGGIWNGSLDPSSSLGPLRLIDSTVARNVLKASAGINAQGGGIFTIANRRSATPSSLTTNPTNATDADAVPPADDDQRTLQMFDEGVWHRPPAPP
jgi:hypothetical protein